MEFVLLIGVPAMFAAAYLVWNIFGNRGVTNQPEAQNRRREDARDWQRRFGAGSLLTTHFLQPTQNEILETLYVLDHLTPGWEAGDAGVAERHFLNELALNFPSLAKANGEFPLPFTERLAVKPVGGKRSRARPATEAEVAASREEFSIARAQANSREQIVSGPVTPTVLSPGSLPFRLANVNAARGGGNLWPARLAGAVVLGAAGLGIVRLLPGNTAPNVTSHVVEPALVQVPTAATLPEAAEPSPTPPVEAAAEAAVVPASPPALAAVALATPGAVPTPPPSTPDPGRAALVQQVAASKQRALSKYPELAVEGSEINLRFVFRYKTLVQQNSPRLLDPNWPEKLVEECAAASVSSLKHTAFTQVTGTHH